MTFEIKALANWLAEAGCEMVTMESTGSYWNPLPENDISVLFRTTVLTDLYDQTKDIKLAQAAAGHTTSAMTLRYYVKGRETISKAAAVVDRAHSA